MAGAMAAAAAARREGGGRVGGGGGQVRREVCVVVPYRASTPLALRLCSCQWAARQVLGLPLPCSRSCHEGAGMAPRTSGVSPLLSLSLSHSLDWAPRVKAFLPPGGVIARSTIGAQAGATALPYSSLLFPTL